MGWKIVHNRIRCKKCGDIIESMSVHDFKRCKCGNCFVDGGHEYYRAGAENLDDIEFLGESEWVDDGHGDRISRDDAIEVVANAIADGTNWCDALKNVRSTDSCWGRRNTQQNEALKSCDFCENHEDGDTLYESADWDGGIGYDFIRDIKYCPLCGRKLRV